MALEERYLQTVEDLRKKVRQLIEKEKRALDREGLVSEIDSLFETVINLPGDTPELYRCRFIMIEALEDLRLSFTAKQKYKGTGAPESPGNRTFWQARRADYLYKIEAVEDIIRKALSHNGGMKE